jgi:hypothetical protein
VKVRIAGLGLVAAVTLTGCGGSSLSPSQLRAVATRSCTLTARQLDRIATPTSVAAGQRFVDEGAHALGREVSELRALHATGTFGEAVRITGEELAALDFTVHGLRAGNDPVVAIKTLQARLGPLEARGDEIWRSLHIPTCAGS